MTFHMLWVIALGLSMDAFAVSISKGLAMRAFRWKQALAIACCFGLFQGIMPAIGYVVGLQFSPDYPKLGPLDCLCFTCAYRREYDP